MQPCEGRQTTKARQWTGHRNPTRTAGPATSQQQQPQRAEHEHQQHQQRDEQQQQHEWILNNPFVVKDVAFNDVIVTDVTVNDLTVTMRESHRPEGFFKHPIG